MPRPKGSPARGRASPSTVQRAIRMSADEAATVDRLAEAEGCTAAEIVRRSIAHYAARS